MILNKGEVFIRMSWKKLAEEEIYLIAEQIILEEKIPEDFSYLDPDDLAKIGALVHRGMQGLVRSYSLDTTQKVVVSNNPNTITTVEKFRIPPQEIVFQQRQHRAQKFQMLYALTRRIAFRLFPLEQLFTQPKITQRRVAQALIAQLTPCELAILLAPYSEEMISQFFTLLGPQLVEDIDFYIKKSSEEEITLQFDSIAAKYSLIAAFHLNEDPSATPSIKAFIKEYLEKLITDLRKYCKQLPERFNLEGMLLNFSAVQWRKLAGLTPRKEMGSLATLLPEIYWTALITPLPLHQQQEVQAQRQLFEERLAKHFVAFVDTIDHLKRFISYIEKVKAMDEIG